MSNARHRQAAGTPAGGQFRTESRAEPEGIELAAQATWTERNGDVTSPGDETLSNRNDERGSYTICDDLHVTVNRDGRLWIERERVVLGHLRAAGLRGKIAARWNDEGPSRSARGGWTATALTPKGAELTIVAHDDDWARMGGTVEVSLDGGRPHKANTARPETLGHALRASMVLAAYGRAAAAGIGARAASDAGAHVVDMEHVDGVLPRLTFAHRTGRALVELREGDPACYVVARGGAQVSHADMNAEQDAAAVGRALGFAGRRAQVARQAREWLAEVAAAPQTDPDLEWLDAGRA